jgi:hypothetical protein
MTKKNHQTSSSEKAKEDWMNSKWRPMMGWTYMITCIFDFVLAPVLWSLTQSFFHGSVQTQWQPLTLQGAGLYHIAMGAVLGIAAYGRTQEKLGGANNGGINLPSNVGTTYTPPAPVGQSSPSAFGTPTSTTVNQSWGSQSLGSGSSFGSAPSATSFGGNTGFGTPATVTAEVVTGWGGKSAPVIPPFPER